MNTTTTRTFRLGLMAEEADLKFVLDVLKELEDDFNTAAEGLTLPVLYVVIDLRINKDRDTFDWDETQIAWYVPVEREDASAERFRQAVIRQVLERLRELEEVPAALIGRIKKLKGA
jgi:hypothetical protein